MNLELSDEQVFLRDAARQALSRTNTIEAARDALDQQVLHEGGKDRPDLWPAAVEAGWPGLLVGEERGGAGLDAFDAILVLMEVGRRLAPVPLIGHLPASALLDAAGDEAAERLASGDARATFVAAQPPGDLDEGWTVEGERSMARQSPPTISRDGTVEGRVPWVVDAPGAQVFVVVGADGAAAVVEAGDGVSVEEEFRYDPTRALGHVTFSGAKGRRLSVSPDEVAKAWFLAQALLAAESVGAAQACLEMAVPYAKERFTFGRAIGSYQAIKHQLVEVVRRNENALSLLYYAGWAHVSGPDEFPIAASAARSAAGEALDYASRANIAVHGGIGATWEHDAPLFFRRAQLTRRLIGGTAGSTDRVAAELLRQAAGAGGAATAAGDGSAAAQSTPAAATSATP
jgi:alkylation response protein AidB-like acyl-CoA dehydrogenase